MLLLLSYLLLLTVAVWVFFDAQQRGKSPLTSIAWGILVFFFWIISLPIWLLIRPKQKLVRYSNNQLK
ncbi:MAG: hypothetical protein IBX55_23530 [Methyloprofundus sp.]|nr:hypothetical protein [Methyloprofundus sp.]